MFLRKSRIEPLPVTMSAVRMGERVLQIGVDDPAVASAIAAKVGLSGNAAIVVPTIATRARAHHAAASAGVLVDVTGDARSRRCRSTSGAFDLVIAHRHARACVVPRRANATIAAMREWHRVLRPGGRVMTIEAGPPTGIKSLHTDNHAETTAYEVAGGVVGALETAGFRAGPVACRTRRLQIRRGRSSHDGAGRMRDARYAEDTPTVRGTAALAFSAVIPPESPLESRQGFCLASLHHQCPLVPPAEVFTIKESPAPPACRWRPSGR